MSIDPSPRGHARPGLRARAPAAIACAVVFLLIAPMPGAVLHSMARGFGMDGVLIVFFSWLIWGAPAFATGLLAGFTLTWRPMAFLAIAVALGALAFWMNGLVQDWLDPAPLYGALGALAAGSIVVALRDRFLGLVIG
jgi:hypothetical protein